MLLTNNLSIIWTLFLVIIMDSLETVYKILIASIFNACLMLIVRLWMILLKISFYVESVRFMRTINLINIVTIIRIRRPNSYVMEFTVRLELIVVFSSVKLVLTIFLNVETLLQISFSPIFINSVLRTVKLDQITLNLYLVSVDKTCVLG